MTKKPRPSFLTACKPIDPKGDQRVGAYSLLPSLIRELGADPDKILRAAGLKAEALCDPENRVPYAALGRLLGLAASATDCPHFGLLAGRLWHLADLGLPGELMRHSATVGDALRRLAAYQMINSGGVVAFVREAGNVIDFGCAIYEPGLASVDQAADMYMAAAINFLRELCGSDWAPSDVFLPHTKPARAEQHRQFLWTMPHFNAEICAIRFHSQWMRRPLPDANAELLRHALARARARCNVDIVTAVSRTLRVLLVEGNSSGDDVARLLGLHRRTLNRRLKVAGTTYQAQLDRVRFEAARQLLTVSDITLDDLAAALGYSGVSPFMRSCKRWTGTTPTRWRLAAHEGDQATAVPTVRGDSAHQLDDDGAPRRQQDVRDRHGARIAEHGHRAA